MQLAGSLNFILDLLSSRTALQIVQDQNQDRKSQ